MSKTPFSLFVAFFGVLFLVIFNYTITIMAAIYVVGELGGSNEIVIYNITFYALGNALGVPLGGAFGDRIGPVKLLSACLLLFALFSLLSSLAVTYPFFIIARFLQGLVSGPFYSLLNRLFTALTPPDKKRAFAAVMLTIFSIGPVLGACWGGWIAYDYNWRYLFRINLPIILFLAWYIHHTLKDDIFAAEKKPFDPVGYLFYFVGILSLGTLITLGQELDWYRSNVIIALTFIGCVCTAFFLLWNAHHPYPLFNFALLKNKFLTFALLNLAVLFSAYFGMVILLALWLNLYADYTPIWIGLLLGTMAISGFFPSFLLAERFGLSDARIPLAVAIIFFAISCFHTAGFNVDINFGRIAFSRMLAGFGLAFFLPPLFRLSFRSFAEEKTLDVVMLFQFVRAISSGIGASIYTTIWYRRQIFYHERLGSQLTEFSQQTQTFFAKAQQLSLRGLPADSQLEFFLERQATSLALDDCFYFMGWVMIGLLVVLLLTLFMPKAGFFPEKKQIPSKA